MNTITDVSRQSIADETTIGRLWYHGRLTEPDFLARLFDLKKLPSRDSRYSDAYGDIYQHMVNNNDWPEDWYLGDPRINILHCDDELYGKFLALSLHPRTRSDEEEVRSLVRIYNKHLAADGFQVVQTGDISGKPVFEIRPLGAGSYIAVATKQNIKKYLNTEYVEGKINTMHDAVLKDTETAIGTAKELLETTCKSILKQKGIAIDKDWTLPQLLRTTTRTLDFKPKHAQDAQRAETAILTILSGINNIVQGVAELRNSYGTGHGKDADFKGLETKFAKLFVGVVSHLVILLLETNGEMAELVEPEPGF
ncbi:abortive infection family protein [Mucilaginibacter sabulilitoris]|uniref:Abortive infection family protein n=1 Tax=Mucilaginibacter sabulilitoris TaxID=1173583 RepID=A0ABZ0TNV1_9SPHI|nr:abortive infection family protein [Mucilaginibacter sabulilitoris]WPU94814.1 abortive infection family protein [Mucilaginibacter sabulilitoris]